MIESVKCKYRYFAVVLISLHCSNVVESFRPSPHHYSTIARSSPYSWFGTNARHAHSINTRPTLTSHPSLTSIKVTRGAIALKESLLDKDSSQPNESRLDTILSQLTTLFPLYVSAAALFGIARPQTLQWVNQDNLITIMLASVMCGTGLTLETKDFTEVFRNNWSSVPLGVACQFVIMPLSAFLVGRQLLLPHGSIGPSLFLGLCLVGCSPGGTASNLVTLIAQANVALSVILTACSTILAVVATPLLVKLLVGSSISVSGWALCQATAKVVLAPVVLGMWLNAKLPRLSRQWSRFTPLASALLVSLICGGVVAQNAGMVHSSASAWSSLSTVNPLTLTIASVLSLHSLGFAGGYVIPKLLGKDAMTCRTISIEVGMQNSALAVVLAKSINAPMIACLPGALSATVHSCLGSLLAALWKIQTSRNNTRMDGATIQPTTQKNSSSNPEYNI
jgi:bile acid:Na+ symporter, BASS family